jgi:hypothetical protein
MQGTASDVLKKVTVTLICVDHKHSESSKFLHTSQTIIQFFIGIVWSLLNTFMKNKKKPKDILTHKQFQIARQSHIDTLSANNWLKEVGLNADTFGITHIRLLQAQQQAHALLSQHSNLLTQSQRTTLEYFQRAMTNK